MIDPKQPTVPEDGEIQNEEDNQHREEVEPLLHTHLALRTAEKYSMVRISPSSTETVGSQPSASRASEISGWRCFGSSAGRGWKMMRELEPVSSMMRRANST